MSITGENEEAFRIAINDYAEKVYNRELMVRKVYIDSLVNIGAITVKDINELSCLEPSGAGNEKPVFAVADAKIADIRELSDGKHLKLTLKKNDCLLDTIAFGFGPLASKLYKGMGIHVAGNLDVNDYNGHPQMIVKEILYK